jgi:hypothetical protein
MEPNILIKELNVYWGTASEVVGKIAPAQLRDEGDIIIAAHENLTAH